MPAGTLPSARVAPPRRFENYILTRVVDSGAGLTNIEDSRFTLVPGVGPDAAGNQDVVSSIVPIGFDFQIDNITYKKFVVSMHGWMALIDPTLSSFNLGDAITNFASYLNTRINVAGFATDQVLLAPWFDDSRALAAVPASLAAINGSYSATQIARIVAGLEPPPPQYNATTYGVRYYNDVRNANGRRLIVRWNIVSNYYNGVASSVLKFECVLYENGTIEYRYSPRASIFPPTYYYPSPKGTTPLYSGYEGATIGIFMPNGTNRFRDFAVGLGYRDGARREYIYGGFVYDSNYTDTDQSGNVSVPGVFGGEDFGFTAKYTVNLLPGAHWPGLNAAGSVFTFSPPLNRRKVLPRRGIREQDGMLSLPTVARTGDDRLGKSLASYDDRRSPIYIQNFTQEALVVNPGAALSGLEWLLPRTGDLNSSVYITVTTQTVVTTLSGDPGTVYQVPLRFRGVVEYKSYSGGSQPDALVPQFRLGGTPSGSDWNIYSLNISDPPATYYLNNGGDSDFHVHLVDYTETIPMRGGATVTMVANPVDSGPYEIANNSNTGGPLSVPGIPSPVQPFVGQFLRMDYVGDITASIANLSNPGSVNYPTTLPRFFGGTAPGTLQRQNLFSGDMVVSGTISKSAVEPYLGEVAVVSMPAFNESRRPDLVDPPDFFATGSTISSVGDGFTQPLRSKTQVRVQLPVVDPVPLPASNSSIFYYNPKLRCWEVPENASYIVALAGTTPPAGTKSGDWSNPQTYLQQSQYPEDYRGFGPMGNLVASSSHVTDSQAQSQTDANFYKPYVNTDFIKYISRNYPKSVRVNDVYAPTVDETFTISISQPFLLEKATFEIPLALGPGWFADQTQCFAPIGGGTFAGGAPAFDVGGPALTIALMRHIPLQEQGLAGQSSGSPFINKTSMRDLIMTGTITHSVDYVSGVAMRSFTPTNSNYQLQPVGFLNYAGPAGAVVPVPLNQQFTGSVTVQAQAQSVAGVDLAYSVTFGGTAAQKQATATSLLTTPVLKFGNGAFGTNTVYTQSTNFISTFGRSGDGFQQAGRAILGNEYATLQNSFDQTGQNFENPLFLTSNTTALPVQIQQVLGQIGAGEGGLTAQAVVSLKSHFPSPYLLMPGDKLILSISKTRPFTYTQGSTQISSSLGGHDVVLMPGAINITLYGSQVAEGAEYHDTLNQPLASDAVHELIGAAAVLDQFEPAYRFEYSGSFSDNVMIGSLLQSQVRNGQLMFTTGSRYRVISALAANISASIFKDIRVGDAVHDRWLVNGVSQSFPYSNLNPLPNVTVNNSFPPTLDTSLQNSEIDDSKAYRTQPWIEQVGTVRTSQFIDDAERYWDSLMPAIDRAFAADGCGIFVTRYGAFGNVQQVNVVTSSLVGVSSLVAAPNTQPLGWIWFDYQLPVLIDNIAGSSYAPLINQNWTKSYPFEPRYQGVNRQLDVSKGLIATYLFQPQIQASGPPGNFNIFVPAGNPLVLAIPPTPVGGFMFGPVQPGVSVDSTIVGYHYIGFWVYFFFFGWFFFQFPVADQGLVYSVNDTCNAWLSDAHVGPPPISGSTGQSIQAQTTFGLNQYGYFTTGSANIADISRCLFGFGDANTYFQRTNNDGSVSLLGTGHYAEFRDQEGPHPNGTGMNGTDNNIFKFGPRIRGWKYGVASGLPLFSKAYWRRGHFGQFRDMLEQRPFTKYYESPENGPSNPNFQQGVKEAVVTVKYLSPDGRLTEPSNTWSSNLSFECTSSVPYIEGVPTNRPVVNRLALNKHILSFRQDIFGNLRL